MLNVLNLYSQTYLYIYMCVYVFLLWHMCIAHGSGKSYHNFVEVLGLCDTDSTSYYLVHISAK